MFKVGDRVWCMNYGWGDVVEFDCKDKTIGVKFKKELVWFMEDGRGIGEPYRILFFEEIPIPKSALKRPIWKSAKELLDGCEEVKFETGEENFYIYFDTVDATVRYGRTRYNFIYILKYISKEDAERIVNECKENNI